MWLVLILVANLCGTFALEALGQAKSDFASPPSNYRRMMDFVADPRQLTFNRFPGISPDYRLGTGDLLEISVVAMPELNQKIRVTNSGEINIPLLGSIQVADLTAADVESRISSRLKDQQLIKNPEVLIYIQEYQAKSIYMVGMVDRPGQYTMSQQLTLMDAMFMAGILDPLADRFGYLYRRPSPRGPGWPPGVQIEKPDVARFMDRIRVSGRRATGVVPPMPEPGTEVAKIDLQPYWEGGVLKPNILLRGGDVIVVPPRDVNFIYVFGEVRVPGAYELPWGKPLLVSQVISLAGGPAKTAKMSAGMLVRFDREGKRSEMQSDFDAILKGKKPDFMVQNNDIIFVPGSNAKTLGYGLLGTIPSIIQRGLIYGALGI